MGTSGTLAADGIAISTETNAIENEGGTRRCIQQFGETAAPIEEGTHSLLLSGEGGDEGLTAVIVYTGPGTATGAILSRPIPGPAGSQ